MGEFRNCLRLTTFLGAALIFILNLFIVALNPDTNYWFTPLISFCFMVLVFPRFSNHQSSNHNSSRETTLLVNDRPPSYSSLVLEAETLDTFSVKTQMFSSINVASKAEDFFYVSEDGLPTYSSATAKG